MATIQEAIALAVEHHQAGRLQAAEQIYRRILAVDPNQPEANHLLGVLVHQSGKPEVAVEYIRRAVALKATEGVFYNNLGNALLDVRQPDEAAACYRRAIELSPDYANAHYNLGNVFTARKKLDEAARCYRRALELNPEFAGAQINLGIVLHEQGNLPEAIACYRRALELTPDSVEAHGNLGNALKAQGNLDEAVACYGRALALKPDYAEAHFLLGNALHELGKLSDAARCYQRAVQCKPAFVEALNRLGNALHGQGQTHEAIACYRRALKLQPEFAAVHSNLGNALRDVRMLDEAVGCYRQALAWEPDCVDVHNNLGNALLDLGKLDEAVGCYRRALELKPDFAEAHRNLGGALKAQGSLDEAIGCYRRALELKPDFAAAHSDLVLIMNYCPQYDAAQIYEEQRNWNLRHGAPLAKYIRPHTNDRSADRRLRIGYFSPHFCNSVTGVFILPLLEAHDRERFEVFCYASVGAPDTITDRCRAEADVWRNVLGTSDEQLTNVIRQDRIDVLVDLAMHGADNRLLALARKPAPVQVAYLAYVGGTGLDTIDYRLTDPNLDPPPREKRIYSEESIYLPETYWCYRPLAQTPPVNTLPALQAGQITFGCLNSFFKVTASTLETWIDLLRAMPQARLLMHAHEGSHRERVQELFAGHGIRPERLTFVGAAPVAEYFQLYHQIDIALDPFPYCGGTTTCDALWMGVPVVSLAGQTAVGRAGLSILTNLGLADLVAHDRQQYVGIATELAADLPRLGLLRATLRQRMLKSPLMDAGRFARHVEAAYRAMWQRWCSSSPFAK